MNSTRRTLPDSALDQLRATSVSEWMRTPPWSVSAEASLWQLVHDFLLPRVTPELPVIATDGKLLGTAHLEDAMATPRDFWSGMRVDEIMRPVKTARTLGPDQNAMAGVDVLSRAPDLQAVPVVLDGILVGDFSLNEIICRLKIQPVKGETASPLPSVRLCFDTPVLRPDGKRVGRVTRLAVDTLDNHCGHIVIRLDGLGGREVAMPSDRIECWTEDWIRTTLWEGGFTDLQDFESYELQPLLGASMNVVAPPMRVVVRSPLSDSTVCLDYRSRVWSGMRSLGRLTEFFVDRDGPMLTAIGYASGLFFRKEHYLSMNAVLSLTDARVNVDPASISTERTADLPWYDLGL